MKTLIINGSPRENGDTAFFLSILKKHLEGTWKEISAYYDNIKPCIDCRFCWKNGYCSISDDMNYIYSDEYDNVVIASPIYMSNLTGPLVCLASRFQAYYAANRFLKMKRELRLKKAALILVGGGDGRPDQAIKLAKWMFENMNANYHAEDTLLSLNTDRIPADKDSASIEKVMKIAGSLNDY